MRNIAGKEDEEIGCAPLGGAYLAVSRVKNFARSSSPLRGEVFLESKARCNRLKDSPFFYFAAA